MIPILYAPNETNFNNNGLGLLYDCIEATVTEERNGQFELSFVYPTTGIHFSEIQDDSFVKAIPGDGEEEQLFRVYYHSKPIGGKVEYKAEHVSYQLKYIPVSPYTASTAISAMEGIADNACENCPFTFWTDVATAGDFKLESPVSGRSVLGGMEGSILDIYGGEYKWDNYLVRLYVQRGSDRGVTLRYGKNITDIRQERNIAETVTGVMPFWTGESEGVQLYVELPEKVVRANSANNYPYKRTIPLDCSGDFSDPPTEAALREAAQRYLSQTGIGVPNVNITVSFVALWQTEEYKDIANLERVKLCDTVTVYFEPLDISAQAKVIRTDYDVLKGRYASIELGDVRSNFTSEVRADIASNSALIMKKTVTPSFLKKEIDRATNLIRGGLGGYVVFGVNSDGEPQEIIIMNTDNVQTATRCIRINKNGIGFSTTGYDGPYTSAWTIDGHFNADFITAGTMSANYIRGGTLTLGGLDNANGVLEVKNASGQTVVRANNNGLYVTGGTISGPLIKGSRIESEFSYYYSGILYDSLAYIDNGKFFFKNVSSGSTQYDRDVGGLYIKNNDGWIVLSCKSAGGGVAGSFASGIAFELPGYTEQSYSASTRYGMMFYLATAVSNAPVMQLNGTLAISAGTKRGIVWCESDDYRWSGSTNVGIFPKSTNGYNTLITLIKGGCEIEGGLWVDGSRIYPSSSSSKRYKHDIKYVLTNDRDPHNLLKLPLAEFVFNKDHKVQYPDMEGKTIPGIIAEDVEKIYPSATIYNEDGKVESWDERRIIPGMLALIQEQDKKMKSLEARLAKLEELLT